MARLKEIAEGVKDLFMIDPRRLKIKADWNVRHQTPELEAHVRWLANSIKTKGVQQPLTIYQEGDDLFISDGHNRLAACLLAIDEGCDIKAVPCRTEERYANEADRTVSLITRNGGLPLTQLEQAEVVKRLLAYGWDETKIAQETGRSRTAIANLMQLLSAPEEIKEMVRTGEVSARTAVDVLKQSQPETVPVPELDSASKEHFVTVPAEQKAVETLRTAVDKAKSEGKTKATPKHLPKPSDSTDWKKHGPKLKRALEAIRDADSQEELQQCIAAGANLLSEMA